MTDRGAGPTPATETLARVADDTPLDLRERIALAGIQQRMLGSVAERPVVDGRYELGRELGAGGMGVVRLAHDRQLDREVAIKFLRMGRAACRTDERRLAREARALARISHPHVVEVFDVRVTPEAFFVAMEYVSGVSLRRWTLQQDRHWSEILAVYRQAALGLRAVHEAGLVHRDFKPANVMVGDDGRVRVVDFGLARPEEHSPTDEGSSQGRAAGPWSGEFSGMTRTGVVHGTPGYASPEQMRGLGVGPAGDQFSWCVALYEALCGQRPFRPEDIARAGWSRALPPVEWPKTSPV
ncbi:MAG: serine/threonine protein kinase, partial [Myxococcales bacterium]|nr:serine/threonine protein kinase [Myxococcales bacterium]